MFSIVGLSFHRRCLKIEVLKLGDCSEMFFQFVTSHPFFRRSGVDICYISPGTILFTLAIHMGVPVLSNGVYPRTRQSGKIDK